MILPGVRCLKVLIKSSAVMHATQVWFLALLWGAHFWNWQARPQGVVVETLARCASGPEIDP